MVKPSGSAADTAAVNALMDRVEALVREAAAGKRLAVRRHIATGDTIGGPSHLGVTLSPWTGGPGASGVICLFTDLSRVVALEEQLRLKDALARLGELTAGLAHEFRNGLATIHGYARLLDPAVPDLAGVPVLVGSLHSQLGVVAAVVHACRPGTRVSYVMTDGAALPLALSDQLGARISNPHPREDDLRYEHVGDGSDYAESGRTEQR